MTPETGPTGMSTDCLQPDRMLLLQWLRMPTVLSREKGTRGFKMLFTGPSNCKRMFIRFHQKYSIYCKIM